MDPTSHEGSFICLVPEFGCSIYAFRVRSPKFFADVAYSLTFLTNDIIDASYFIGEQSSSYIKAHMLSSCERREEMVATSFKAGWADPSLY